MKTEDDWERGALRHPERTVLGGGRRQKLTKRGMKINVNNNEIRGENCVLEQVYRLKDIEVVACAIKCYETEGCHHGRRVRSMFTYSLFSDVTNK
jgi:retron-type reverse transcriptase